MKKVEQALHRQLMAMQDEKYKQFNCKLIPNVPPEKCIGIRTGLRKVHAHTPSQILRGR